MRAERQGGIEATGEYGRRPIGRFPRSDRYDPAWVARLNMGPNPLWQLEDLLALVPIEPGQRVLDLGAGLGATSVFLARECGARVDSYDHWVDPPRVQRVVDEAGVADRVTVRHGNIRLEPHDRETYDVIISVDAWEYFGTDVRFLRGLLPRLAPGGRLGFTTPMLRADPYDVEADPALADVIGWELAGWHAPAWWKRHTELTGGLEQVVARLVPDSLDLWIDWETERSRSDDAGRSALLDVLERLRAEDHAAVGEAPVVGFGTVAARSPVG